MSQDTMSQVAQSLAIEMQALEEALLHNDHASTPGQLERMLAPEFTEIASSGRRSDRAAVLHWLLHKDPAARWQLHDLQAETLAPGLRLVRYHAQQVAPVRSNSNGAWHCSLWTYSAAAECWQLRFHQATRLP